MGDKPRVSDKELGWIKSEAETCGLDPIVRTVLGLADLRAAVRRWHMASAFTSDGIVAYNALLALAGVEVENG